MDQIIDILENEGSNVKIVCRIERVLFNSSTNGSSYVSLFLVDNTSRIEARLWNSSKSDEEKLKVNCYYLIEGSVSKYRNNTQLKVKNYNEVSVIELNAHGYKEEDFFVNAPIDVEADYKFIIDTLTNLKNKVYSKISLDIIKHHEDKFKCYPAAISIHHNVVSGLLWHSISLLKNAIALKPVYSYADIDWDLVYAGCVLHDIGKVIEMNAKQASDYTLSGKLLGHISIGNTFVADSAIRLKLNVEDEKINSDVVKLQHTILSSHGKHESGSPVEPQLIEAIIISSLDELDARLYKVNDELSKVDINNFTPRLMTENNRFYFKHFKNKKD